MNQIEELQHRRNEESRNNWAEFAEHRTRVTRLLLDSTSDRRAICILGAGNSNDIDLNAVLSAYQEVHLVDLDNDALQYGVSFQQCDGVDRIQLHGGVDLTSIAPFLARGRQSFDDDDLNECARRMAGSRFATPRSFSMVASVCVLSQLLEAVDLSVGKQSPQAIALKMQLRAHHLGMMIDLLAPGGTAVLVADFVSSATFPELVSIPPARLMPTALRLIQEGNFFTGMNPAAIARQFKSDADFAPAVEHVRITEPWLWNLGPRVYLVSAIVVRRKAG